MDLERLKWDSDFFGFEIYKALIKDYSSKEFEFFLEYINTIQVKLIQIYPLDKNSSETLLNYNIPLMDTKVILEKKSDLFGKKYNTNLESYNDSEDYDSLEKLALLSGKFSRYKTDVKFSNNEFSKLYREWLRKSITKEIATDIILYKTNKHINGFISYKMESNYDEIVIGLIAVAASEHGNGIGKVLMQSIENIALNYGVKKITVATQLENKQALSFYNSCGYTIKEKQEIYHLWN